MIAYYSVKRQSLVVDCCGDAFMFAGMRNKKASQSPAGTSTAVEDYLERILELINSKGYARVIDIAAALKISQASVTNMVQRLDSEIFKAAAITITLAYPLELMSSRIRSR